MWCLHRVRNLAGLQLNRDFVGRSAGDNFHVVPVLHPEAPVQQGPSFPPATLRVAMRARRLRPGEGVQCRTRQSAPLPLPWSLELFNKFGETAGSTIRGVCETKVFEDLQQTLLLV